jgi:hypothetical protein
MHAPYFSLQNIIHQSLLLHLAQAVEGFTDNIDVEKRSASA